MYICFMKATDHKTTTITFRTTVELKKKLEKIASKESRSVSNMIEVLLETAVKERK